MRCWMRHGDGAWENAEALPLTDRAVRYGMAVFETLGVREGKPLLPELHAQIFSASTRQRLGMETPLTFPPLGPDDRGMLRVYTTAGDGGPADPVSAPRSFAIFEPLAADPPMHQTARLHPVPSVLFAHGAKTGNYWTQCAAQADARADGFDHALLHDLDGNLLSAAMGNLFFTHDGELCTPALSLAVRPGAVRAWVLGTQPVREVVFLAERLREVEEIFLTNSRLGVMPLRFASLREGPMGCALRDRCRREKIIP